MMWESEESDSARPILLIIGTEDVLPNQAILSRASCFLSGPYLHGLWACRIGDRMQKLHNR